MNQNCNGFNALEKIQLDLSVSSRTSDFNANNAPFLKVADLNQDGRDDLFYPEVAAKTTAIAGKRITAKAISLVWALIWELGFILAQTVISQAFTVATLTLMANLMWFIPVGAVVQAEACWRVHRGATTLSSVIGSSRTHSFFNRHLCFGLTSGDFNGDGRDDLLYRGDCEGTSCWRIHRNTDSANGTFDEGEDWGGDYFPHSDTASFGLQAAATSMVMGHKTSSIVGTAMVRLAGVFT